MPSSAPESAETTSLAEELDKAHATLSEGHCQPDDAQKMVHDLREKQANGATDAFATRLASLKKRINTSKFRLRKKRKKKN